MPNHPRYHLGNSNCSKCDREISYKNTSGICRPCKSKTPKYWHLYDGVRVHVYTWIFLTEYGPPPHLCYWCAEPITDIPLIHHIDEDRTNNNLENLAPMHKDCHNALHHWLGRTEANKKISERMKKYWSKAGWEK